MDATETVILVNRKGENPPTKGWHVSWILEPWELGGIMKRNLISKFFALPVILAALMAAELGTVAFAAGGVDPRLEQGFNPRVQMALGLPLAEPSSI